MEFSLVDRGGSIKKSKYFYFFIRKFNGINNIYRFISEYNFDVSNKSISNIINIIIKNEDIIYRIFIKENLHFFNKTFTNVETNKKILLILKGGGMEETIEKSFISYCNNSNLDLTVLYKFGTGYWGQKLNQDGFFNELVVNNRNVEFIYKEDFDDNYIDLLISEDTEVFSFQYDYGGKYKDFNLLVLSSVVDDKEIDCSRYKNIFSCYKSESIGYSTDKFVNYENTNVYKIFNPQNIDLLNNFCIIKEIPDFILSGGMAWARDFSILNSLNGIYKGVMISDEVHNIKSFLDNYRGIQSHYGFLGVFKLSSFGVFCHLEEFNNDDRSKMIATSISAGKPVIVPYNKGLIVKEIIRNELGLVYENGNKEDFLKKIDFFANDKNNIMRYSQNCLNYSKNNMDINKFINFIFEKIFNDE